MNDELVKILSDLDEIRGDMPGIETFETVRHHDAEWVRRINRESELLHELDDALREHLKVEGN